jgi:hypothetical protein
MGGDHEEGTHFQGSKVWLPVSSLRTRCYTEHTKQAQNTNEHNPIIGCQSGRDGTSTLQKHGNEQGEDRTHQCQVAFARAEMPLQTAHESRQRSRLFFVLVLFPDRISRSSSGRKTSSGPAAVDVRRETCVSTRGITTKQR